MCSVCLDTIQDAGQILDLLPTGGIIIDQDLKIIEWNRTLAEWTSITKDKAIGTALTDLFPNIATPRYLERLTQVFTSGFPATYSAAFHKHFLPVPARHGLDCELMIQQTEVRQLPDSDNLALITIQDVSFQYLQLDQLKKERTNLVRSQEEIARVNQELVERNQELDDFTRIASHDLQEPLRKITTFGEMLAENLTGNLDEDSEQFLFYVTDAAKRMKLLIKDLMTLSRTGLAEIQSEDLDLKQVVNDALDMLGFAIAEKKAVVEIAELPTVLGDQTLLTQLFQNLIGNAIKFSSSGSSRIRITADQQGDEWVIGVQDNGIGIQEKHLESIFDPFIKLHSRDQYEGTGFGLSICKKAVTKHGGRIWVESIPGEGAHFKFTLPHREE